MTDVDDRPGLHDPDLFGASLSPGRFNPVPVVTIGGVVLASGPGADGPTGQTVLDGLSVKWGRDEVLDQPEPASGTLEVFDATRTWATSTDLRGLPVVLSYTGLDGTGATVSGVFFRGRIGQNLTVRPHTVIHQTGTRAVEVRGSLVTLPLQSILVDLANQRSTTAWPEETLGARRARLNLLTGVQKAVPGLLSCRSFWEAPNVAPVAAADQIPVLEHIENLYDSCGADRYSYDPNTQAITYLARRDYFAERGLAGLWWNTTSEAATAGRAGQGVYIRSYTYPGGIRTYLDSAALEYDPGDGLRAPPRVTRVQLTHKDGGAALATRTVELSVDNVDELEVGTRQASLESQVTWNSYADVAASDLRDMVTKEAAAWRLEPIILRTRPAGGFESAEQAQYLLTGAETTSIIFLQRSWLPAYGLRPTFGVMGGVIGYRNSGWELEMELAPMVTTKPQHAITWEEIDDGTTGFEVQWHDDDHPHGMHESLTLDDLGYVSTGLGVNTIPADTGWDSV